MTDLLAPLLECPRCRRAPPVAADGGHACRACGTAYPRVGGLPWLFPDPALALGEWRNRAALYLEEFALEAARGAADLATPGLRPATRARLELVARAWGEQGTLVRELLAPLGLAAGAMPHATQLAAGTVLPPTQDLHSYYANVHRDWCWGDEENRRSHELVAGALGPGRRERLLVLGAGAGRLAYDLHQGDAASLTVALDLSPLLLLAAERIVRGGAVDLWEFPLAPRAEVAVRRRLAAPAPARPGLELVLADAWHAPFAAQSFDAVVTPWLVDIVELDLGAIAAHVNRLLAPGGRWVNFGSLAFPWRRPALRYGRDEALAVVEDAGFAVAAADDAEIPYLQSPASRHGRVETVVTFAADKVRRGPREPAPPAPPPWLADTARAVPRDAHVELAATAGRIQAVILALVDGRRSIDDLARILVEQGLLEPVAARAAVQGLLERLHRESERGAAVT